MHQSRAPPATDHPSIAITPEAGLPAGDCSGLRPQRRKRPQPRDRSYSEHWPGLALHAAVRMGSLQAALTGPTPARAPPRQDRPSPTQAEQKLGPVATAQPAPDRFGRLATAAVAPVPRKAGNGWQRAPNPGRRQEPTAGSPMQSRHCRAPPCRASGPLPPDAHLGHQVEGP